MAYEVTLRFESGDRAMAAFDAIEQFLVPDFISVGPEPDDVAAGIRSLTELRSKARPATGKR